MKHLAILVLLILSMAMGADAYGIEFINVTHHVSGSAFDSSYDWISSSPDVVNSYAAGHAESDTDPYFDEWALSEAGNLSLYAEAGVYASWAEASSKYLFTSSSDRVQLNFSGTVTKNDPIAGALATIALVDVTNGTELFYQEFYKAPWMQCGEMGIVDFEDSFTFATKFNHEYELVLQALADTGDSWNSATMTAELASAPIPGPITVLLFGSGLLGFAGIKRIRFRE